VRSTFCGYPWKAGSRRAVRSAGVWLTYVAVVMATSVASGQPGSTERKTAAAGGTSIFVDRSAETGFDFHYYNGATGQIYLLEIMGAGGGLVDFDNDGDLDIYAPQGRVLEPGKGIGDATTPVKYPLPLTDRLYRNDLEVEPDGSRFLRLTDVTDSMGFASREYGIGVATGDFDNDGWVDLYVTNFGSNQLLRNDGDGTFSDVTERVGAVEAGWSSSASFLDLDRDGWLDLFVTNYLKHQIEKRVHCMNPTGAHDYCDPDAYPAASDRLFRNRGDGTFEDVSVKAGTEAVERTGLGVVSADFDLDGWPDLYVANDGMANLLLLNNQDGTYRDDTVLAGCAVNAEGEREASMGVDAADIDGDGDEEIFLTHYSRETNTLYLNTGDAIFDDATQASGLGTPSWSFTSFGTRFLDYDNDGLLDLAVVSGAVTLFSNNSTDNLAQTNQLFRGLDGRRFVEVTQDAGPAFQLRETSRGAAFGDLDNDGDTDIVVFNNAEPSRVLINEIGSKQSWLGLRLIGGDETPRDMLGARVELVRPGRPSQWRRVRTDGSFASASDPRVLFGLGEEAGSPLVRVTWPSGTYEQFSDLPLDQYTTLVEGTGRLEDNSAGSKSDGD